MSASQLDEPRLDAGAPRRRGCLRLGCFVKSGLGCGSFLLGAVAVLVALLPWAAGSIIGSELETSFRDEHMGSLEIGRTRFAWVSPMSVDGLTLRGPDGAYVGTARLLLPSLADLWESVQMDRVARMRVDLDANLIEDDDGVLNLERALALREELGSDSARTTVNRGATLDEVDLAYTIGFWRAAWSSPAVRATGRRQVVIELDQGELLVPDTGTGKLVAHGVLVDEGPGKQRSPLRVELAFASFVDMLGRRERARAWAWTIDGLSAELLAAVGPGPAAGIPYAAAFGERVGSVRVARLDDPGEVYEIQLRGADARLDLAGVVRDGALHARAPEAERGGDVASVDFALDGFWRDSVVLRLLPFLADLSPSTELAVARLELFAYTLPRDGAFADVVADVRLNLGEVAFTAFASGADPTTGFASEAPTRVPPVRLYLEGGRATLAPLSLALGAETLELSGAIDPVAGSVDLSMIASPALAARALGVAVAGDVPLALRVTGSAMLGFAFERVD
jgi:hypothetical protein